MEQFPKIIQGGMGAGVSDWRLARAVSREGQLGVVSGVALEVILARRLQDGDPGGHMRTALAYLPIQGIAQRITEKYFIEGGKPAGAPYKPVPMHGVRSSRELIELTIAGSFVEVWLARQEHSNPVGINYLEKVQLLHLYAIYGAMLAGVDYVLMGAGIPLKIPGVLDALALHQKATYPLQVAGAQAGEETLIRFDPSEILDVSLPPLKRPKFLAIIASNTLATTMVRKANGRVDGFVIEGPTAGGHNAPPRGKAQVDADGELIYGDRDVVDLAKIREVGLPFWLAGGYATPDKLSEALAQGAAGVQIGTAFQLCEESGLREDYKRELIRQVQQGYAHVRTDRFASPTGFPFKVAVLPGTSSEDEVVANRVRTCDVGQLREAYRTPEGNVGFRCAAEPIDVYLAKGGAIEETEGRKCLCNCLLSNIGLQQFQKSGYEEPGMVTAGNDLAGAIRFLQGDKNTYTAADVLIYVLGRDLSAEKNEADAPQLAAFTSVGSALSA